MSDQKLHRGAPVGVAVTPATMKMPGIDILRGIMTGALPAAGISKSLNFWIDEVDEGRVVFAGEPGEESLNPMGGVHGGWSLTMIDSACGCAAMSLLPPGIGYTTLETKGNLTRAIKANTGVYRCEAKILANGRQVMTSDATITGPDGKLYAHGTSTLLVLRER
ncbi:MAG: PaaI family thioesterase [Hyphomonadaceae bacterium]